MVVVPANPPVVFVQRQLPSILGFLGPFEEVPQAKIVLRRNKGIIYFISYPFVDDMDKSLKPLILFEGRVV